MPNLPLKLTVPNHFLHRSWSTAFPIHRFQILRLQASPAQLAKQLGHFMRLQANFQLLSIRQGNRSSMHHP